MKNLLDIYHLTFFFKLCEFHYHVIKFQDDACQNFGDLHTAFLSNKELSTFKLQQTPELTLSNVTFSIYRVTYSICDRSFIPSIATVDMKMP